MQEDRWAEIAERVIRADAASVLGALRGLDHSFIEAARRLVSCPGKVLVTGSGTSGTIAHRAAHLLSVAGTPAFFLQPADGLHGGLGALRSDDLVLALSKGGSSDELNEFCQRARQLCSGLIVITAAPQSRLARLADVVLLLELPSDSDLGSVVATGSSLSAAAMTDALVEVCRVAKGYGWDQLLYTHPSGAVGRDAADTLQRLQAQGG
jgi:arabinose-5-phosphate isomerase